MCVNACLCAFIDFFFQKTFPQKLLTGLLPNFIVVVRKRLRCFFFVTEESGLWSVTGAQVPLVYVKALAGY